MGFRLKIEGQDNIEMNERQIKNVEFCSDIPMDSNARAGQWSVCKNMG